MADWANVRVRELRVAGRARKREPFAILPLELAAKAAVATGCERLLVWIWLVHQARKSRSTTVVISNETLARYGISRKMKALALRELEQTGLISVQRHVGRAPSVTLLC